MAVMDSTPAVDPARAARERLLARLVDGALERGWRDAGEFLRYFPAEAIIEALTAIPELRTRVLVDAAKLPPQIAVRHSSAAAREDLEIALEAGLTSAASLVAMIPSPVRARIFDPVRLWGFAVGGDWLARAETGSSGRARAAERLRFVLETAIAEHLVSVRDLLTGISHEQLAMRLAPPALRKLATLVLEAVENDGRIDPSRVFEALDLVALLGESPPEQIWREIVLPRIAEPLGLTGVPMPAPVPGASASPSPARSSAAPPPRANAAAAARVPLPPPPPRITPPAAEEPPRARARQQEVPRPAPRPRPTLVSVDVEELSDEDLTEASQPAIPLVDVNDGGRRRVADHLAQLGRLPANHGYLSLAILRSIAKMYAELPNHKGKSARAQCVRECFDSDSHLRAGMSALLELLDADMAKSVADAATPVLVDAVLLAEKAIWQRAKGKRKG